MIHCRQASSIRSAGRFCEPGIKVILYKYFKYEDGLAAFDSRKCVFTKPTHFNDPFEWKNLSKESEYIHDLNQMRLYLDNELDKLRKKNI